MWGYSYNSIVRNEWICYIKKKFYLLRHINIYPSDIDDLKSIIKSDNNISGYSIVYRDEILISSS